jgi:hypothetical protein
MSMKITHIKILSCFSSGAYSVLRTITIVYTPYSVLHRPQGVDGWTAPCGQTLVMHYRHLANWPTGFLAWRPQRHVPSRQEVHSGHSYAGAPDPGLSTPIGREVWPGAVHVFGRTNLKLFRYGVRILRHLLFFPRACFASFTLLDFALPAKAYRFFTPEVPLGDAEV